jgi:hypothetical protein
MASFVPIEVITGHLDLKSYIEIGLNPWPFRALARVEALWGPA